MTTFRRALVTGGAGFLGSHLCEHLLDAGTDVVCLDNTSTGRWSNVEQLCGREGFVTCTHDVTEPLPRLGRFDLVCHLASPASPADYQRLGVETLRAGALGTMHALDVAAAHDSRFLLASTSEVYGDPLQHPQTETYWGNVNPIGPRSVYDEAKRFAEACASAYRRDRGVDVGIARIFNTYGPRMRTDDGRMIPTFVTQARRGEPLTITGTGEQTRSLCYVDDTVAGLVALAASHEPGPVNIGNDVEMTVREIASLVATSTGSTAPLVDIAAAEDDPRRRCPDIRLAERVLGWRPRIDAAEGLRRTVEWFDAEAFTGTSAG